MHPDTAKRRSALHREAGLSKEEFESILKAYQGLLIWFQRLVGKVPLEEVRTEGVCKELDKAIVDLMRPLSKGGVVDVLHKLATVAVAEYDPVGIRNWDEVDGYIEGTVVLRLMDSDFLYGLHRYHVSGESGVKIVWEGHVEERVREYPWYGIEILNGLSTRKKAADFYHAAVVARGLVK